ncbi:MAG: 50S ribosomal protein L24 [Candidatus Thorarchaeota archaeon]
MTDRTSPKAPRKQRRILYEMPIHRRRRLLRCRLDDTLREEYGTRSLCVKKGDLVRIMRGQFRDTEGKITRVDYRRGKVYIDSVTVTKADGKEAAVPVSTSNLMLVKLQLDDERKRRLSALTSEEASS